MLKSFMCGLFLIVLLAFSPSAQAWNNTMLTPDAIQGTWVAQDGQNTMMFTFMGSSCTLFLNGMQMQGMFSLSGNQLSIQFQNGRSQSYTVALQGDSLILDGQIRLMRQGQQGQQMSSSPLDGVWQAQIPQGTYTFNFRGNTYRVLVNGQPTEEGVFTLTPDGQFTYRVTQGQNPGQTGTNRIFLQGNSLTMNWPDGTSLTFYRTQGSAGIPQMENQTPGNQTPLEGRWKWAKNGPISFGYVFSGNRYIYLQNNMEVARGTFTLSGVQLIMHHETGPDAGKTDYLGYQLNGNRLLIFVSDDPNSHPIPFVRY